MDLQMACLMNPSCKHLQDGVICPHMQGIRISPLQVQLLPRLRRVVLPPVQPPVRQPRPPPVPLQPLLLPLHQEQPTRVVHPPLLQPQPIRQVLPLLPKTPSEVRNPLPPIHQQVRPPCQLHPVPLRQTELSLFRPLPTMDKPVLMP